MIHFALCAQLRVRFCFRNGALMKDQGGQYQEGIFLNIGRAEQFPDGFWPVFVCACKRVICLHVCVCPNFVIARMCDRVHHHGMVISLDRYLTLGFAAHCSWRSLPPSQIVVSSYVGTNSSSTSIECVKEATSVLHHKSHLTVQSSPVIAAGTLLSKITRTCAYRKS
jgi:hypothetical protein